MTCLSHSGGPPWERTFTCEDGGTDGNGHGTHVAGTAAARDNGSGVVGVAPGASLWGVKVLDDSGSGSIGSIVAGIGYVTDNADDIDVANMSLGCECDSDALDKALTASAEAGVVYVAAAGNDNTDAEGFSPANHDDVIAVSAIADFDGKAGGADTDEDEWCTTDFGGDDERATFSNYGEVVDLAAPGVCILSTYLDDGLAQASGTSMASPHVAGAAALYIVENDDGSDVSGIEAVRNGVLADWTVRHDDACGYDDSKSKEPLLVLAPDDCAVADESDGADEPEDLEGAFAYECDGLTCDFTDESTGEVDSWNWNFGDDSPESEEQHPTHTYDEAGTYTGTLTVEDDSDTDETTDEVTVSEPTDTKVTVDEISYSTAGNWHLRVTVSVVETDDDSPVEGAEVTITLSAEDEDADIEREATGTTEDDGTVTFRFNHSLRDADCYTTTVDNVNGVFDWDGEYPKGTSNCPD